MKKQALKQPMESLIKQARQKRIEERYRRYQSKLNEVSEVLQQKSA